MRKPNKIFIASAHFLCKPLIFFSPVSVTWWLGPAKEEQEQDEDEEDEEDEEDKDKEDEEDEEDKDEQDKDEEDKEDEESLSNLWLAALVSCRHSTSHE